MALPDIKEVRQLSDSDIADEIVAVKRKLFNLRFQKATRQLEKEFHQFKHARHRLGQLMTVQRERQLEKISQEINDIAPAASSADSSGES